MRKCLWQERGCEFMYFGSYVFWCRLLFPLYSSSSTQWSLCIHLWLALSCSAYSPFSVDVVLNSDYRRQFLQHGYKIPFPFSPSAPPPYFPRPSLGNDLLPVSWRNGWLIPCRSSPKSVWHSVDIVKPSPLPSCVFPFSPSVVPTPTP